MQTQLILGDCLDVLKTIPDGSVDSVVTDPPYELGFMAKAWDGTGIAYRVEMWAEALRVLKPGGHLLAFGGTRTYHRMACAIEDAGFEIRDSLHWHYASGFPKSRNIGEGRGTALKPSHEPIILARKALAGTVSATAQVHGTGTLNIDACRVSDDGRWPPNTLLSHTPECGDACTDDCAVAEMNRQHDGASDFFPAFRYQAKPSTKEKEAGCEHLEEKVLARSGGAQSHGEDYDQCQGIGLNRAIRRKNIHPTVKPVALMEWLVSLVTPKGGVVLDPFMGSGTTGMAAGRLGFGFVGIEREAEYFSIAQARIGQNTSTEPK
jgi:site-specific DNA-methyltransferase (adenine-specific)